MVKRVLASEELVPVGRYDCIVVDEAHRGYTLDRDMTEGEIELHDFRDYISAYRQVLDYFDAVRIGLTATPATHTVEIFGRPVFTYSYREAVIDGWLIDSQPPYNFNTQLSKNGIHFEKESSVDVVNVIGEVRQEILDDEMDFEVDAFNRKVLNDNFNHVICTHLAQEYLDPYNGEKTLIFCVSDIHADLVVEKMKEALAEEYPELPDNTVMKITGSIRDPRGAIREYKNEKFPNIAVTVDLLTTGIDVPSISNLVFLRRVRSRILYEQMKGRATRLCPEIDKDFFRIFDAVGLYKVLEKVDSMKPVVQDISLSFEQLLDDLNNEKSYQHSGDTYGEEKTQTHADNVKEQLIVKLQMLIRRSKKIENFPEAQEPLTLLETLTNEKLSCSFESLPQKFKALSPKEVGAFFSNNPNTLRFIDELREGLKLGATEMIISTHEDSFISVERGYGEDAKGGEIVAPEDYLESFNSFIKDNINKISALSVVVTRPRDLTRADLKSLQLELSKNYFSEKHLNTAWKNAKNEEIGATIIGFIRSSALGSPLVPYKERVERALKTIKTSKQWNSKQEKWLELLAKQLIQNIIIDDDALQSSPFKERGGRKNLERVFEDKLYEVLDDFSEYMWA
jgi:type I restriction enzyme R subunit